MSERAGEPQPAAARPPLAVVVVNWNGRKDLPDCLRSLSEGRFTRPRVIMVDNGSRDDSVAWTREHFPAVEIIETGGEPALGRRQQRRPAAAA